MSYIQFPIAAALALLAFAASAQPSDGASGDELIRKGLQALQQIDQGQAGALWDGAPAFVKAAKPQAQFADELQQARATVGDVIRRDWASVVRIQYPEGSVSPPPGLYANVDYATRLANGGTVYEKLSFRLEPTGWRLTGYEPRRNQ